MKLVLFLFLNCLILIDTFAQIDYIPIAKEGNFWIYYALGDNGLDYFQGWHMSGDTTINNELYQKVYEVVIEEDDNYDLQYQVSNTPYALMRDDSLQRKAYCIFLKDTHLSFHYDSTFNCQKYENLEEEVLYFDYSLKSGDTLDACTELWESTYLISRESVLYFDIQTYNYNTSFHGNYMGFGPNTGLFHDISTAFIPKFIPRLRFFCNGTLEECSFNTKPNSIQEEINSTFNIFPNPGEEKVNIKSADEIEYVNIYSLQGELMASQTLGEHEISLNTYFLKTGIYFVQCYFKNGQTANVKFIKK